MRVANLRRTEYSSVFAFQASEHHGARVVEKKTRNPWIGGNVGSGYICRKLNSGRRFSQQTSGPLENQKALSSSGKECD